MTKFPIKAKSLIKSRPIIAIIGGAGPDAAIDLQIKLSYIMKKKLDINFDQEHYRVIIDNNTSIPNRDEALLHNGPSPLLAYINSVVNLEKMGCNILTISCNTAHSYFEEIQKITNMKLVNMIEETASFLCNRYKGLKRVGLLSTSATIQKKLYYNALNKYGIEVITPDVVHQNNVMQAIYGIKAGIINDKQLNDFNKAKLSDLYKYVLKTKSDVIIKSPKQLLFNAIEHFEQQKVEMVILGCTEIPLALDRKKYKKGTILIDSTEILANAAVDYAISLENITK